uniref:Uncharacterized protein n=1 Tax=Leptobrachium leishanense TaxID=445787 RepID=A0A8C5WC36_9ANUR
MVQYRIQVATGPQEDAAAAASSNDNISIALVGTNGESIKKILGPPSVVGAVQQYNIQTPGDLGEILCVRLYKACVPKLLTHPWFCKYVHVISPDRKRYQFPCHRWICGVQALEILEGKGVVLAGTVSPLILQRRRSELDRNREKYRWKVYAEGAPYCIDAETTQDLSSNEQYSCEKLSSFGFTLAASGLEATLKGYLLRCDPWKDLNEINNLFSFKKTHMPDLTSQMWNVDTFFGYQYLNGVNPMSVRKCTKIPGNFPVTQDMVASTLGSSTDLQQELESGNIFLADYNILEGIPTNTINGKKQYLAAPLCLLWKSLQDHLIPIAIQLGQQPGPENPIFLASDHEWDWTLAKIWVRNAEFQVHEVSSHLLRTHLLAEVFSIASSRNLPMQHPLSKLLLPHFRYTLDINVEARTKLVGPGGIFDKAAVTGNGGVPILLKKAVEELTYTSLCLPDDLKDRGIESIPKHYYREDGMKIWSAMEKFVSDIVNYYYKDDDMVSKDPELQAWIEEIFKKGFLERESSGIPSSLTSRVELIKFLTMVIFTCTAQHAAVNSGQFDFYSWMPNGPSSMRQPPPTTKGETTLQSTLDALPEVNTTTHTTVIVYLLSNEPQDKKPLGQYSNPYFTEEMPLKFVQEFQRKMADISTDIQERNNTLNLKYLYLDPNVIESSVSI